MATFQSPITQFAPIVGGANKTLVSGSVGNAGEIWTSNGAGAAPTFQAAPASGVTSVSGTANRITSSGGSTPVIDISASYVGQSSITTLGTIASGTWSASVIDLSHGGTNANLTASNGGIFYSTASAGAILSGTATAGQVLRSGASTTPSWSTATYPATAGTSGNVLTSDGTNWSSSAAPSASSYSLQMNGNATAGFSPADGITYYLVTTTWVTTGAAVGTKLYIPKTATLKAVAGVINVAGTLATTENVTFAVRLNDTSNTNVTTTLQLTSANNAFSNTGLSTAVTAGDFISFLVICPTWSTNPTTCNFSVTAFFA